MAQVARNLTAADEGILSGKRYLIRGRDPWFTAEFLNMLADTGVRSARLPPHSPTNGIFDVLSVEVRRSGGGGKHLVMQFRLAMRIRELRTGRPRSPYLFMAIPFLVAGIVSVKDWTRFISVVGREKTARGVVIRQEGGDHERYEYVFQVNGQEHSGWHGNECKPDVLVLSEEVEVIYDPANPDISDLCSFSIRAKNETWFVLSCLGAILVIFIFSLYKPRERRIRKPSEAPHNPFPHTPLSE